MDSRAREIASKRVEIERRYASRSSSGNLRLGEVRRILRSRGKDPLQVEADIDERFENLWAWPADALGDALELTFDEKIRLGVRTIRCFDKTAAEVAAFYHEQKRARDRVRIARRRQLEPPKPDDLSARAREILDGLRGQGWVSAVRLVGATELLRSFRNRRGRLLDTSGRRQAVHRALSELERHGALDVRKEVDERGLSLTIVRVRV
jgi:hypothetical protein